MSHRLRLHMRAGTRGFMAIMLALAPLSPSSGDAGTRPVLLELFTSQSCSSCPPADAVLRELATQEDLLPLSFHVDYWNGLGWVDPYSSPAFTARQQAYAAQRGFEVYTPQLVVDGKSDVIGSSRSDVATTVASARREAGGAPSSIMRTGGEVNIAVGPAGGAAPGSASGDIYLLSFDSRDRTDIRGGENAGRSLVYTNVVRSMRRIGQWRNETIKLTERLQPEERGDRLALIVQDRVGRVWAVASTAAAAPPARN